MSNPAIAASPTPSAVPRDVSVTTNAEPFKSQDRSRGTSKLGAWEIEDDGRPPFILSVAEMKLLAISGVKFYSAYDLFIINPVSTMLQFLLYDGNQIPAGLQGVLKASANIGSILGQFGFGMAADYFGRRAVYGKELMLIIFATIMCISNPTNHLSPNDAIVWLICWRVVLGVGVGGDYPMSASVATDRSNLRKRGVMLSYIFSSQGWGSFVGSIVVMTVLLCYKHVMETKGETSKVDGVWRIVIGVSLIPAFGTLYHRLTLPETTRFIKASAGLRVQDEESSRPVPTNEKTHTSGSSSEASSSSDPVEPKTSHVPETLVYFSEWRHAKHLIGTSLSWFLLDIAFYGINLNQNVVLQEINFDGSTGTPWHRLWRVSIGNLIITGLGFVPGYYATVLTIEYLGRKWIQVQGFLLEALFLAILASKFHTLGTAAFIVNFSLLQFFFNFGANATTFAYPAELFPTRFRATAHGVSAACGKGGAVISALGFNALSKDVGTPAVLWIFFGCSLAGAVVTVVCLPEVKGRDPDLVYEQELRAMQSVGE
ncbi:major facilitator superfamily domain-containing protein [Cristinia sonorae]|uniref:Major facilitator superfamily domain-containing protein n=1 Tax=Cristinia sonorae TaxID=1940300 RepID=A0A8K0UG13_9AGAR|nr:major facilitator superfamily domain-containing protein [Cristinia sonorae]